MTTQNHLSTSKKRLLSDHQKPKQTASPGPGLAITPSDDELLLPQKKTRDLPNLSDCHGCGLRINQTNPKDRLQLLDSVWRIVLFCKKCIKRVELGQTCPYCFKESVNSECFKCCDCERLIHNDCIAKHKDSSPWSLYKSKLGSGSGLEFSVCIDCWVPKMFRKSIRIRRRKNSWKVSKNLGINESNGRNNGNGIPKDARCLEGREIVLALRAPRKLLIKSGARGNRVELANKDNDGNKIEGVDRSNTSKCGENMSVRKDAGNVELAFQLHRAMNRSSRISKNSVNTNSLGGSRSGYENGSSVEVGKFKNELITYQRRKSKKELKTYKRGCLKRKRFLEIDETGKDSGECREKNSDSCFIQQGEMKRECLNDGGVTFALECDGDDAKQGGVSDEKSDRYLLKYSKRKKGCKSEIVYDTSRNENQTSGPEVLMNSSFESRALSDASPNSLYVDLQAYDCAADHQEKTTELSR